MPTAPITFHRTTSADPDFRQLVGELNAYLAVVNGADHAFYDQHSQTDTIPHALVARVAHIPVGCGALREIAPGTVEIKRMFVPPHLRGRGLGSTLLERLEDWARELGYDRAVLETGSYMPDAVALYRKNGYAEIDRYPPYEDAERSVCFAKTLERHAS